MYTFLLLLQDPSSTEPLSAEPLEKTGFYAAVCDAGDISPILLRNDRNLTLVVTDSENTARAAMKNHFPVIGWEHDGLRLSSPREIIDSLEALTPEYCLDRLLSLSGRKPVYSGDTISLFPVSEDGFLEAYECFREEPYMLTDEQRSLDRSDVIALYRNRRALAQFTGSIGTFRAEAQGVTVGYGSIHTEDAACGSIRLTVDFYVIPERRRMGYGAAIVRALVALAHAAAASSDLYANVHPANTASARTLEACGFTRISAVTPASSPVPPETPPAPASHDPGRAPGSNESPEPPLSVYWLRGHR